ncbi:hypothetical protein GGX14DRAFT_344925 [Mycena pura]|uniref:Uncharacterized protein n=1 Tax=Mycena pura TaxID=153505 RepID=A0AAD7E4U4_9AGAR|nr:hypothetical protein GGX14DRAFT_344925 [Mycena pura]
MISWSDPAQILKDSNAFDQIVCAFFGLYSWEVFMTFGFEISLLTRRRRFRWPLVGAILTSPCNIFLTWSKSTCIISTRLISSTHSVSVFFFLSRYCMLLSFIGLIISLSIRHPINCGALFAFNSWTGNMAILCASTSLMLRTIALWERKRSVVISLGLLSLTHWILLYRTMFVVRAVWDSSLGMCVVASTNASLLNVTFFFTMGFDFVILSTTAVALTLRHSARTDLWKLLFTDGLVYFVVTFSMNCVPAVLNLLNLNAPMNVYVPIPAATVSSIAACRAVTRLLDFNSDVYVHSLGAVLPTSDPRHSTGARFTLARPEGVIVTTEHITMSEFACVFDASSVSR